MEDSIKFTGTVIQEQGVKFGIIIVKSHVINASTDRNNMMDLGYQVFGNIPIILYDNKRYYGRTDIVEFLSEINSSRIPWKVYTLVKKNIEGA